MAAHATHIKVLLVEDNPCDIQTIEKYLAESSVIEFEVAGVTTLKDALEHVRTQRPDVVLLDLLLPDSEGLVTLRAMHKHAQGVPIVVLTILCDELLALNLAREGAQEYLIKTQLNKELLIRTLQYAIGRKSIEAALRVTESQYSMTVDSISDALHVVDSSLCIVLMNKAFKEWSKKLGFASEVEGRSLFEVFPFLPEAVRREYDSVFTTGKLLVTEEKTDVSGRIFHTETRKIPIFENNKVAQVITLVRDITERKKMEDAFSDRERFLNSVFMSIQDGVSVLDCDMNIVRVNATMEKWYAHAMPLVGKKCYQAYHSHSFPCKACPTMQTLKTKKASFQVVTKRGSHGKITGWLDLYSFPLFDTATGEMTGVIEYVRDITARKKAEKDSERLNSELLRFNKRFKLLSLRDPHTGLYNHRYLEGVIESEFHRAKRYYHPLSVILVDIDYFKSFNDVYGHEFGDLILKQLARQLKRLVRGYDSVVRLGGEEFLILSPGTDRPSALIFAQRVLDELNLFNFGDKLHAVKLKLSLAVVTYPDDKLIKGIDLVDLAEKIVARAKESGGNRVCSSIDSIKQGHLARERDNDHAGVKMLKNKLYKLTKKTNQGLMESIFALSKTIELKDHYTGEHVERTVQYVSDIAQQLNLPREEIESVKQAAMLHDIGKIGIPEKILLKKSKLTKGEFEAIKKHPQIGADILRPIQLLHDIIPLIFYHHERWDGKGYLHGLKREEIPLGARIIAIADVYQALTSDRPYRKAFPKIKALRIIETGAGAQFDPRIAYVFLRILKKEV